MGLLAKNIGMDKVISRNINIDLEVFPTHSLMYLLTLYYDVVLMRGLQLAQGQGLQGAVELLSSEPKTEHLLYKQINWLDPLLFHIHQENLLIASGSD